MLASLGIHLVWTVLVVLWGVLLPQQLRYVKNSNYDHHRTISPPFRTKIITPEPTAVVGVHMLPEGPITLFMITEKDFVYLVTLQWR
jgi:hypothetical protein